MGMLKYKSEDYTDVITCLNNALEINPRSEIAHEKLGDCYGNIGNNAMKMESYEKALYYFAEALRQYYEPIYPFDPNPALWAKIGDLCKKWVASRTLIDAMSRRSRSTRSKTLSRG
jgi:tetratricopeptide (TPR) repeat protein